MTKAELKVLLEDYWYDNQYLKEKAKEVEKVSTLLKKSENLQVFDETKQYEESQIRKILEKKNKIEDLIQELNQPYRTIMYMKYISFLTFDQIADKINYSTKRIYQLHTEGFNNLLNIINSKKPIISKN